MSPSMRAIIPAHCTILLLIIRAVNLFVFEMEATSLSTVYKGADKSLNRSGRKQARKHVRDVRDFNNIGTRAVINDFSPARQGPEGNSRHSDRNISLFPSRSG